MAVVGPSAELTDGKLRLSDPGEGVALSLDGCFYSETENADPEQFYFPVTTAVRLRAGEIRIPKLVDLIIMNTEGQTVAEAVNRQETSLPADEHLVQVSSIGLTCYLRLNGPGRTYAEDNERVITFSEGFVDIGLRSNHDYPKATVQTTNEPRDIMRAVSCFGSALQTTSPERSWPTLRGCPPFIDTSHGSFKAPAGLERVDTPIRIELPPALRYIYPVTSLAMYLNAEVVPGPEPLLIADDVSHELHSAVGFEQTVQRTLEQVFFFDCIARTDGLYLLDLHERAVVDERSSLNLSSLYDRSLAEQVNAYLSEPWSLIEDIVPTWKLTADVAPDPKHAGFLPFAANDLAHIRVPTATDEPNPPARDDDMAAAVADFERREPIESLGEFQTDDASQPHIVNAAPVESIEHAWVGEGVPIGASKPTIEACHRQLQPIGEGPVSVQVIVNDKEMRDERVVSDLYGLRDLIQMEVAIDEQCTVAETRCLLKSETDFVHYIGHVTEAGMQCADGYLDARTLNDVGMRAFVLNACRSYQQGRALVDAGAVGGVVTLSNVTNVPATVVGQQIAQLLNCGFSLSSALNVIGNETVTGRQYVIVGDGNATLTLPQAGVVICLELAESDGQVELTYFTYPTTRRPLGAIMTPYLDENPKQYLNGGRVTTFSTSRSEVQELLSNAGRIPVQQNGTLTWADQVFFEPET